MNENITIKKNPKIEFHLLDNGFELIDGQSEQNSGFYPYHDLQGIDLKQVWFPRLAKWLRITTWILNGVPYFPDAASCKKAKLVIHSKKTKLGIWLTDLNMAYKAKMIKALLLQKTNLNNP